MASINKVILVGNLGRDPEVRRANNGNAIANLNLATTETWKDKNSGERQTKTEWHRVVIFGGTAEVAEKYLKKGSSVYIEGKLQTRKWTDAQGQDKYSTEVVVESYGGEMQMLDGKGEKQDKPVAKSNMQPAPAPSTDAPFDDEIPF